MDLESKLSEIIQLLLSTHQNKKTSLQLHNDLFSRINTFVYISQDPNLSELPDTSKTLLTGTLDELKEILDELASEEDGLFQIARQFFSQTTVKRLEAMIPRLLKLSDQLIQTLTVQKYIDHKINQKRKPPIEFKLDDEVEEIQASMVVNKKVKTDQDGVLSQNRPHTDTQFHIKFFCHPRLEDRIPIKNRQRLSDWCKEKEEDIFIVKRDDFLTLPKDMVVKVSKEHAKVRAWKQKVLDLDDEDGAEKDILNYEIIDQSINGTYYLGNKIEGMSKQKPMKLKRETAFPLRNGDCVGILMNKEAKTNEILVGFEFSVDGKEIEEEK